MHVGIIMDGNRRFAKKRGMPQLQGHALGVRKVEDLFDWAKELGIDELTLYTFSMENFHRSKEEVDYLMDLLEKKMNDFKKDPRITRDRIRLRAIGRLSMLPAKLQKAIAELTEQTKEHDKLTINFAIAYGGRSEIADAARAIAADAKAGKLSPDDINEESFPRYLMLQSQPDLIIRTGGAMRTSNFLPWQSAYSEWFFLDKFWPEMAKEDVAAVLEEFKNRERRFGK